MANHESARTTGLYDRPSDEISLDEVEWIGSLKLSWLSVKWRGDVLRLSRFRPFGAGIFKASGSIVR